jgi:hypothetical protein
MKDMMGNSISDDAEFDDLDEFDYVDQFSARDEEGLDSSDFDDDYDDLDDLYIDEESGELDEADENEEDLLGQEDEDAEVYSDEEGTDEMDEELEARFICEECGHKWVDFVSETDEENDLLDINCPMCGSANVTTER